MHSIVKGENFVYDISMSERLLHGNPVSDEQIQAWADEAERGYTLTELAPPLPVRPLVGRSPGIDATRPGFLPG